MSDFGPSRLRFGSIAVLGFLAAGLLGGPGGRVRADEAQLGRARQLLHGISEGHVRQGREICVKANSVESTKLLLEVLRRTERLAARALARAHYRDIVWDGLVRIRDPYARELVAKRAVRDRNPWVRQWAVELIGIWGDPELAGYAVKACRDRHRWVQQWAARTLGLLQYAKGERHLLRLSRDKSPYVRANALDALARIDAAKHAERFLEAVEKDRDGEARCALLGAAAELYPDKTTALSRAALADEDWRPRMQAVAHLSRRPKDAAAGLVAAGKDGRPVVAHRAMEYLRALTGKEIRDADAWAGWWRTHRESYEFPEEEKEEDGKKAGDGDASGAGGADGADGAGETRTVAFNDIPLVSDHVAFLIDKSRMMKATLKSKNVAARQELDQVLGKLHGRLVFNVYCYRDEVAVFRRNPVELDERQHKLAIRFVEGERNTQAKDIWQVLEMVVADPDIDTGYLLSSGEPDIGLYVHWNRVTRHLRDLNRFHKVTIHTVVYSGRKWYRDQLEKIAQTTGGDFKWFE